MFQIRICVHDDYPLMSTAVQQFFGADKAFEVVEPLRLAAGEWRSRDAVPDVVIMELDSFDAQVVEAMKQKYPNLRVLLLGNCQDLQTIFNVMQNGADGYLSRRSAPSELIHAARCVFNGEQYLAHSFAMQLIARSKQKGPSDADRFADLTDREEQILKLLGIGLSNKEIGWRLTISEKTVKHYLTSILGKLNVKNRVQAAILVAGRSEPLSYA